MIFHQNTKFEFFPKKSILGTLCEGYTQVNVTPAQEDLIEPVGLIDRGLARDQLTVQVQLVL